MRMRALACLFVASCLAVPAEPSTTPEAAVASHEGLAELARAIDPGPQPPPPLHTSMPAALATLYDERLAARFELKQAPAGRAAIDEVRAALAEWEAADRAENYPMVLAAVRLGDGLVLAERAVRAGSTDPELQVALLRIYHLLHHQRRFADQREFAERWDNALEYARTIVGLDGTEIAEATAALKGARTRAAALQMHATARLLRDRPTHPAVAQALSLAAETELDREAYVEAVALRRQAIALAGPRATGEQFAGLAEACFAALDLKCGDMALKSAAERGAGGPEEARAAGFERRLKELATSAERARRAVALAAATGLAERAERADLLRQLLRFGEAEAEFAALRAAHPGDARPLTGLAMVTLQRDQDFARAAEYIQAGRGLAGRDRNYYESGLVALPVLTLAEISAAQGLDAVARLAGRFDAIDELTAGYRAFDPARAAVLELLTTTARAAAPKLLAGEDEMEVIRPLPEGLLALTARFPASRDAWRLLLSTVVLVQDRARARALATTPLPPALQDDPELRLQQACALVDLALLWEDREMLETARLAAEGLPATVDADAAAMVRTTVDALKGVVDSDRAAVDRALAGFERLAVKTGGRARAIALNNAGALKMLTGDPKGARRSFKRSDDVDRPTRVAALNGVVTAASHSPMEPRTLMEALRFATDSPIQMVRLYAHAWLVESAEALGVAVAAEREALATALRESMAAEFRGTTTVGRWSATGSGELGLSLGYSFPGGLEFRRAPAPQWWLLLQSKHYAAKLAAAQPPPPPERKPAKPRRR